MPTRSVSLGIAAMLLAVGAAACGSGGSSSSPSSSSSSSAAAPHAGGSLTVLEDSGYEGAWPAGLDPATNTNGAANQSYMNSIFGQLFELGTGGTIIPDLATGYSFSNGAKTVTIDLRSGVKFTDGSPLTSQVVVWNIQRDLKSPCTCKPTWPVASVQATGPLTVQINLSAPYGAFINTIFDSTPNWIASETAFNKMGEKQFSLTPVGAGPFEVVSNTPSSVLVLKRNPGYWQQGRPYLNNLTFKAVGGDEAAYEAMLAGGGQVYEDMSTPALLKQAGQHFTVFTSPSTSPYDLQLNTLAPPFNNVLAREAIYYATNFAPISQHIFDNLYPATQSFTGPGGICYEPTVPGYRTYDLAKAKALVKQLGGLTINLGTINVLVAKETTEALQTEWAAAGIKTTISSYDLASLIQAFVSKSGRRWCRRSAPGTRRAALASASGSRRLPHQRRARHPSRRAAEPGRRANRPGQPLQPLRPGRSVHQPAGVRADVLRLRAGERSGPRSDWPRSHLGAAGRRGDPDDSLGGRLGRLDAREPRRWP